MVPLAISSLWQSVLSQIYHFQLPYGIEFGVVIAALASLPVLIVILKKLIG